MVCKKCEKKLTAVAAPDKWKEGSKNSVGKKSLIFNQQKKKKRKNQIELIANFNLSFRY